MKILKENEKLSEVIVPDRDIDPQRVVDLCNDPDVRVLCFSVSTTTGCYDIRRMGELLTEAGIRGRIVYNAGGAPVTEEIAESAGCDVFSRRAIDAVRLIVDKVSSAGKSGYDGDDP